jgi:hypothetical protein
MSKALAVSACLLLQGPGQSYHGVCHERIGDCPSGENANGQSPRYEDGDPAEGHRQPARHLGGLDAGTIATVAISATRRSAAVFRAQQARQYACRGFGGESPGSKSRGADVPQHPIHGSAGDIGARMPTVRLHATRPWAPFAATNGRCFRQRAKRNHCLLCAGQRDDGDEASRTTDPVFVR